MGGIYIGVAQSSISPAWITVRVGRDGWYHRCDFQGGELESVWLNILLRSQLDTFHPKTPVEVISETPGISTGGSLVKQSKSNKVHAHFPPEREKLLARTPLVGYALVGRDYRIVNYRGFHVKRGQAHTRQSLSTRLTSCYVEDPRERPGYSLEDHLGELTFSKYHYAYLKRKSTKLLVTGLSGRYTTPTFVDTYRGSFQHGWPQSYHKSLTRIGSQWCLNQELWERCRYIFDVSVNSILLVLDRCCSKILEYTKDFVVLVSGMFPSVMTEGRIRKSV